MTRQMVVAALIGGLCGAASAEFKFEDDGKALTVVENGQPVLTYRYARVDPPEGVPQDRYWRMSYVHPLYAPGGDVLTEDFPDDHYHHRGIFWAWPYCSVGERRMDTWAIASVRQLFDQWLEREATATHARLGVQNVWKFDGEEDANVRERVYITVHPERSGGRAIDFALQFQNVSGEVVTLMGSQSDDKNAPEGRKKGYGGFCIRPDKSRVPLTFTAAMGEVSEDILWLETPWADVSSRAAPNGPYSGVAIFQHPENPGYPHPGWIFRHYGFLGASWPHDQPYRLQPGEHVELRYRVYVHAGTALEARVPERFETYVEEAGK